MGPTILSEHDCVMHFARFLAEAGVPWEDIHLELSPGQWMLEPQADAPRPPRIDLAIASREALQTRELPARGGDPVIEAVFEFALASVTYSSSTVQNKIQADTLKVEGYLEHGLAACAYVVVIEERDHSLGSLPPRRQDKPGPELVVLPCWKPGAGDDRRGRRQRPNRGRDA